MITLKDLNRIELFSDLVHSHAQKVLGICESMELKAGDTIFNDGDEAQSFYFILRGKIRISKQIPGMGEEALAILGEGESFGEMALIDASPRSADAICNSDVVLGTISTEAFENLLFMNKDLAYDLLWIFVRTLSDRLRDSNEKMRAFLTMAGKF